jgi:hypothetical protein
VKVEEHVRNCAECAAELHEMEFTRKVFKTAESRVPTNGAVENIFRAASEALREEEPAERKVIHLFSRETLRPFLVGAASVLLIIGTLMFIMKPFSSPYNKDVVATKEKIQTENPSTESGPIHLISAPGQQSPVDRMFDDAENLFNAGRYESALTLYKTIYRGAPEYKHEIVRDRMLKILDRYGNDPEANRMRMELLGQNP